MIKACIFDLDGTLCDSLTNIAYFANKALKHFGLCEIATEEYKYMIGNGYKNLIIKMLNFLDVYTDELFFGRALYPRRYCVCYGCKPWGKGNGYRLRVVQYFAYFSGVGNDAILVSGETEI